MRTLLAGLATSIIALALAGCGGDSQESARSEPPQSPGRPAPSIEGVTVDGKRLSLADFRGKPVFVNVWSSW